MPRVPLVATLAVLLLTACGLGSSSTGGAPASSSSAAASPTPFAGCPGRPLSRATPPAAVVASPVPPRGGAPKGFPSTEGFTAFAVVDPGVLSRSGTPTATQFQLLRNDGWKGIVDVRTTDDRTYTGFTQYGFAYLQVPIAAADVPSDDAAAKFLCFVTDPANQPVDVHDNSGVERVGLFVALYRYAVQGWQMADAVHEETLFGDSLSDAELAFLYGWSAHHVRGEFRP